MMSRLFAILQHWNGIVEAIMHHRLKYCVPLLLLAVSACGPGSTGSLPAAPTLAVAPISTATPPSAGRPEPAPTPGRPAGPSAPALGNWHDMIYHEGLEQVVLVNGGPEAGKPETDPVELWAWDDEGWSLLSADPDGPRWRNFASLAYDSLRQVLVLYGGLQSETEQFADTWEWDGTGWTERTSDGPGLREGAGMAYDRARERTVLFGGAQEGRMMEDTWTWDGERWAEVEASGPAARFPAGFAYDAAGERVLLFGGHAVDERGFTTFGDTWAWDGAAWQRVAETGPAPRDGARTVFDPQTGATLLFGGVQVDEGVAYLTDTWLWDGDQWQEVDVTGPPGRVHAAMAADLGRGRVVLAGGSNAPGVILPDVWEWDGQAWTCAHRCQ
jgi:hypothetical protein